MNWHCLDTLEVMKLTGSKPDGLSNEIASLKLAEYGPNILPEKKRKPAWLLFLKQFKDFMTLVLITAALISGIIGDMVDTIIIMVIVFLNAIVGFVQEYRAEKAIDALKKLATPQTNVLRNGKPISVSSTTLVPGEIVLLEAGTLIPADMRLTDAHSLRIEESSLTGESVPVDKVTTVLQDQDLPLGDRINMAYKGTLVTNGRGRGIIVATGMNTEIGKIALLLQEEESLTPLQIRMTDFGKKLSYIILVICSILFGVGMLRGEEPLNMLLVSISLAIAAIPEALPALTTIALAMGAKRLVKKNVLIRKLPAVETLGSVSFICSDKTGTLTQNKMKVVQVDPSPVPVILYNDFPFIECAMLLNQDVMKTSSGKWLGDPTEVALIEYVENKYPGEQIQKLFNQFGRVAELPFDSDRKCMTTIHHYENQFLAISKGATESILTLLKPAESTEQIIHKANKLAKNGIRVLAYAYRILKKLPSPLLFTEVEKGFHFAGLVGMIDPPREEAKDAIHECKTAGIKTVMITGDHRETAAAIAREIGILQPAGLVVSGNELMRFSQEELDEKIEKIKVYARVSPDQKLNIVRSLQRKKYFVAMTGDGVNDAPSLKTANIGIAMGISGTDVSKEASHMILLDDNFATIVNAVREGRKIYDNIRKFVKYIMTCNSAEIWTIFLAPLIGLPIPLLPVQILWINLITDGLPGLALSTEKAEENIMQRPPRPTDESLFADGIGYHIIWVGLLMAFITLGTQAWAIHNGDTHWQTMVFTVLSLAQLGHVFAIRSDHEYIFKKGIASNLPLLITIVLTFLLQMGVVYFPFANDIFKTQPLSTTELLICVIMAAVVFHAVEAEKWIKKIKKR